MDDWAVRNIKKFSVADPVLYAPLLLILILALTLVYTLRNRTVEADPPELQRQKKLTTKQLKRLQQKEQAKVVREAREQLRQDVLIQEIINDESERTGISAQDKIKSREKRDLELNELRNRQILEEVKLKRVEADLVALIYSQRWTPLDSTSLKVVERLLKCNQITGMVQQHSFLRISPDELESISGWIILQGKVSMSDLSDYMYSLLD